MGKLVKNGISYTGGSGAKSYNELNDKPSINGVTLSGNKTPEALGLVTKAVNDLVNYWLKTETYSKTEVDAIVTAIKNSRFEVVATLPTSDIKTNVIYLVPKADAESGDIKDEYINLDGTTAGWERIGSTDIDLSGYVTTTALNTALANYTTTTDLTTLLADKQDKMQYTTLPTASAELVGKIVEYTGTTSNGLTHGYFYECVSDGENPATYSWQQTNVQPSNGGGGSYTAGDGIDITNDVISTKQSQEGDIDEIIDVYPTAGELVSIVNAFNRGDLYSTDEKMIGQWTDGKPLYQKTINFGTLPNATIKSVAHGISNLGNVIDIRGWFNKSTIWGGLSYASSYENATNSVEVYVLGANVAVRTVKDQSSYTTCYITLQYTKTTDSAISIGDDTDYSTEEKIVGTWIDGKPLYQCTFSTIISQSEESTWKSIASVPSGIEVVSKNSLYMTSQGSFSNQNDGYVGSSATAPEMYTSVISKIENDTLKVFTRTLNTAFYPIKYNITLQYTKSTT